MSQRKAKGPKGPAPAARPYSSTHHNPIRPEDCDTFADAFNEFSSMAAAYAGRGVASNYLIVRALLVVALRQCISKGLSEQHVAQLFTDAYVDALNPEAFQTLAHIRSGSTGDA